MKKQSPIWVAGIQERLLQYKLPAYENIFFNLENIQTLSMVV